MNVHADSKWDCHIKKSNVRVDSQREMSEMLDWLMQIQMHKSRQREQLTLMTQIQKNKYSRAECKSQNMYKEIEWVTLNTCHADHQM
jgi:hypothetical protein